MNEYRIKDVQSLSKIDKYRIKFEQIVRFIKKYIISVIKMQALFSKIYGFL